jgi:prepilin-type N-terminal cleavage/methylation domain-containing protein
MDLQLIDPPGVMLMKHRTSFRRPRASAGFSLIELMIAAALLAFIALGLIPLFVQSMQNNETGSDYSAGSNGSKSGLEVTAQVDIRSKTMELPVGGLENVVRDSWTQGDPKEIGDAEEGTWWPGAPTDKGRILWRREMTTHEYSMGDLDKQKGDYTLTPEEREAGAGIWPNPFAQLKEVDVILVSESDNAMLGGGRRVSFRTLKGF